MSYRKLALYAGISAFVLALVLLFARLFLPSQSWFEAKGNYDKALIVEMKAKDNFYDCFDNQGRAWADAKRDTADMMYELSSIRK